jgi:hypothetical protein
MEWFKPSLVTVAGVAVFGIVTFVICLCPRSRCRLVWQANDLVFRIGLCQESVPDGLVPRV